MKLVKSEIILLTAGAALLFGLTLRPGYAGSSLAAPPAQGSAPDQSAATSTQEFTGTVIKTPPTIASAAPAYIIYDENRDVSYFLESSNPMEIVRLEGQRAKIEGALNASGNTIEVTSISAVVGSRFSEPAR